LPGPSAAPDRSVGPLQHAPPAGRLGYTCDPGPGLTGVEMMRLAVLSDIHGNLPALEAVLADVTRRGADGIVNLGDSVSGPLMASATAGYLMQQAWVQIAGNHDRNLVSIPPVELGLSDAHAYAELSQEALDWLARLPPVTALDGKLLLIHGTPARDTECLLETVVRGAPRLATPTEIARRLGTVESPVVLCGHSHIPRSVRTPTGRLLVNPGSVGLQAYEHDDPEYHTMETGAPDARYAVVEERGSGWLVELISVPYDHRTVVDLANRNGRPDWATALATGTFSPASSLLKPIQGASPPPDRLTID